MIETSRLYIRECQLDDKAFIFELFNQPECIEFIGDKGLTDLAKAEKYLESNIIKSYQLYNYGLYAVTLKPSGEPIGLCGLVKRDYLEIADLGFALLSSYAGQGMAFEACNAVLDYCTGTLGINKLLAMTNPNNVRSLSLLERLGFTIEPTPTSIPELQNLTLLSLETKE